MIFQRYSGYGLQAGTMMMARDTAFSPAIQQILASRLQVAQSGTVAPAGGTTPMVQQTAVSTSQQGATGTPTTQPATVGTTGLPYDPQEAIPLSVFQAQQESPFVRFLKDYWPYLAGGVAVLGVVTFVALKK